MGCGARFLMPQRVAVWIYWHAVLLVRKGVSFLGNPKNTDLDAYRASVPRGRFGTAGEHIGSFFGCGAWRQANECHLLL